MVQIMRSSDPSQWRNQWPWLTQASALRNSVPAVYKGREFAAAEGLMSYGSDIAEFFCCAALCPFVHKADITRVSSDVRFRG